MSWSGRSRVCEGSRACSKRSVSAETTGSTNPSWSTRRIVPPGPRHARELGDDELRAAGVVQNPHAARDVERSVLERQGGRVADDELAVRRRELVARCDEVGREVDADDVLDEGRQRERERTGSAAAVQRALAAVERRQELLDAILERRRAPFLARQAVSDHVTHRRPHAPLGWPARRSRRRSHRGSCLKPAREPRSAPRRRST